MSNILTGNITAMGMIAVTIDPASIAANTSVSQTFTVPGLRVGDMVIVNKPTTTAGVTVGDSGVSGNNTLDITFGNLTAGALNPGAELYQILWFRNDAAGPLPSAVLA